MSPLCVELQSQRGVERRAIFSAFSSLINSSPGWVCPALIKTAAAAASVRQHFPGAASFALWLIPQLHASKTSSGSLISSRSPAAARPLTSLTFLSPFLPPQRQFQLSLICDQCTARNPEELTNTLRRERNKKTANDDDVKSSLEEFRGGEAATYTAGRQSFLGFTPTR